MAEFSEGTESIADLEEDVKKLELEEEEDSKAVKTSSDETPSAAGVSSGPAFVLPRYDDQTPLSTDTAVEVLYCGNCSLPLEYCVFGQRYEECIIWRQNNLDEEQITKALNGNSASSDEVEGSKKKGIGPKKKGGASKEQRVSIHRIQRQKRKFVTQIVGLDTIPDLNLKDTAKLFGKRFASGCSVGDIPAGGKEIVIQGDVYLELPEILMNKCKVDPAVLFIQDEPKGPMRPYAS